MLSNTLTPHFTKDRPFPATLRVNRLLNKPGSEKETRHFVVDIAGSNLSYEAGDSLGIYPSNRPSEVEELLDLLGASGEELVSPAVLNLTEPIPLREALTKRLALAKPGRRIVETLARLTVDAAEWSRLDGLLRAEAKQELAHWLEAREYVDVLAEFPGTRIAPQEFVDHLRKLMPRLYSIASSSKKHPTEVHLTVAVVRYETNERDRVGVASSFLADRAQLHDTPVPVFISHSHFRVPTDGTRDIIMVGPGTGIAPFRAFMQERAATGATGRNWLFFGDQHRKTDFLYEDEWGHWQSAGTLHRLDLAFSRDQQQKVYVQDRMRDNAAELWNWLEGGAYFYVCGDAKRMAKDVDLELHEITAQYGGMDAAAAATYVKQLKKDNRYLRDVY